MKTENLFKNVLVRCAALSLLLGSPLLMSAQEVNSTGDASKANQPTASSQTKEESSKFEDNLKFFAEIGGQYKSVTGEKASKFDEYGETRKGLWIRRFRAASNPPSNPEFFRVIGRNAGEDDQQYVLDFGKYGSFRTKVEWSSYSHLYTDSSKSLFTRGFDRLEVDDSVQTLLQNTADAAIPATVQSLYAAAPIRKIKSQRGMFNFEQTVQLTKDWSFRFNWNRQERSGNRPHGSGSYERVGTPTGDTFRVHTIEIPESIQTMTDHLTFGTSFFRKNWGVNFDYTYSQFKNDSPYLRYDNPFRITDLQATGNGGVFDRMKMTTGELALEPSNHSQTIAVNAFVDLPRSTRLAGAWAWSFSKQDEDFLPFGTNTAIVSGVPAGLNITSTSSLPEKSLNGEVETFSQDYVLASRPWKNFGFNVHYRNYDNENKTEQILFPGYIAYLESYWRTNIAGIPIENEVQSFNRSNMTAEAIWDISKSLRWKLGYEWEGWTREHRQTAKTNEHALFTQFTYKPTNRFDAKLNYRYSTKTPDAYNGGVKEFSQLRMFDQAKRLRHDADLQWQYALTPKLGLSGTLGWSNDDYDQNFFGLVRYSQAYGTIDLLYIPKDNTTFYLNYARENNKHSMQTIAKTAVPFDLRNRWNRDEKDALDSFGVGVTSYAMKDKAMFDVHYVFSNATTKTNTYNLTAVSPINVLNATAFPFPDVKSRVHEFNADVSYQFTDKWGLGIRYIYQPYTLDDYAWNGLSPYPTNILPASEQDGRRFLLLDSRYSSHNAHVMGVYFRFGK